MSPDFFQKLFFSNPIDATKVLLISCLFMTGFATAQNDTLVKGGKLSEVIVTGQFNPQSVDKSVFQVKVISRADIDRQAGNNLADLLNQTLNISVMPNASTGKSGVQLFGLDAQYFKILVDNVPLINDEDLGSDTDLTQINLDDIQQIEIVEGAMGVEYGANAVSGIINIITKKKARHTWEITPFIQEETIGEEYNGVSEGRHIQSIRIAHNFSDKWTGNAMFTYNDFDGYHDGLQGRNHYLNDSLRGYRWLPKQQLHAKAFVGYNPNEKHRFFYRFEYFNELTHWYNPIVDPRYDAPTDTYDELAQDRDFETNRMVHLINASGTFSSGLTYDFYASYQQQERNARIYNYYFRRDTEEDLSDDVYESRKVYYSKATVSNFLDSEWIDFQLGYEVNTIRGYASMFAYEFIGEPIERNLGTYDFFGSTEMKFGKKFTVRPGVRGLFSSQFNTQVAVSLSGLYDVGNGYELRAIIGTCPRLPDYEELYSYFVDVNHNVQGNPDLKPEQGVSAFLHLNKVFKKEKGFELETKLSAWYIDVQDRIELIQTQFSPPTFRFANIDLYRTIGSSLTGSAKTGNWLLNAGVTYGGIAKVLNSSEIKNDDFLYSVNVNGNLSYTIPKWKTTFSAFGKYNGPQYQFVQQYDENQQVILVRGKLSDYTMIDATVRKTFAKDKLEVTLGARNLADVTTLNTTAVNGSAHTAAPSSQLLGYGRSYFLKILYRFNFG
ncbi:TonB-dependent receptor plug domain-containing protein [Flavobacterium silvaticum]|uniref:TonB-dependent receptor plug domain-containing protein n=1 Tax=Flavobacterium silvaticum TaxID=1852020 RepID=A0A972FWY1_9FLAO|nr:TonB-dependent receptor plug domain-containing protein [Flavobacterium silvaticum]NMH29542.1 TonB-dependent receptor plug domain-containing protein [Flavobacterium silvaticum]